MRGREATGDKTVSEIIRIVIAVTLIYALMRFVAVKSSLEEAEKARRTLRSEVQQLREEKDALEIALRSAPDEEEIEKLARERLGLVMPDETIYTFNQCFKEG